MAAVFAPEGHDHQSRHVERRHESRDHAHDPGQQRQLGSAQFAVAVPAVEDLPQDFVLREESAEGKDARDGQRGHQHGPERPGQLVLQPAQVAHVLLVMAGQDHATAAQEERGLEEGVGEDVEHARGESPGAHAHEHEAQLADGRIGQHLLDVVLRESHRRRHQRRERAHEEHDGQRHRRVHVDEIQAGDHVEAAGHHGRRVNQRADRRRARHGVRQPDVERDLGALAAGAHEQTAAREVEPPSRRMAQAEQRDLGARQHLARHAHQGAEVRAAVDLEQEEETHQEAEVADAVGDERLLARGGREILLEVEADEQVAAQADAFPAQEHHQQIGAQHEVEHREHEEVQVGHEAVVPAVLALLRHVTRGKEVDQEAHARHQQCHRARKRIKAVRP